MNQPVDLDFLVIWALMFYVLYLRRKIKFFIWQVEEAADFSNGNTHDGFDEGQVMGNRAVASIKKAALIGLLDPLKRRFRAFIDRRRVMWRPPVDPRFQPPQHFNCRCKIEPLEESDDSLKF